MGVFIMALYCNVSKVCNNGPGSLHRFRGHYHYDHAITRWSVVFGLTKTYIEPTLPDTNIDKLQN